MAIQRTPPAQPTPKPVPEGGSYGPGAARYFVSSPRLTSNGSTLGSCPVMLRNITE